jgi:hypothetical protein
MLFLARADGKVIEGDIEVNARYFTWTDLDLPAGDAGAHDRQTVLTHEMGHLIGVDHLAVVQLSRGPVRRIYRSHCRHKHGTWTVTKHCLTQESLQLHPLKLPPQSLLLRGVAVA